MTANKLNRLWMLITLLLVAIIVAGAVVAWSGYRPGQTIEISLPPQQESDGTLYTPGIEEEQQPQRININRAEVWLLKALPDIGEVKAQAIIDYRQQNGPFRSTNEITRVAGIGTATYERIKHLITVAD
jgi:comEA protein